MLRELREAVRKLFNMAGYEITPTPPPDMEEQFWPIYRECKKFTATSVERMYALYKATQYVARNETPGDVVECGIWKGGSSMLCALTLKALRKTQKKIYMYDTYSGMTEPTEKDVNYKGEKVTRADMNKLFSIPLAEVKRTMYSTGYPPECLLFVEGKVEDTIPGTMPEKIALLRLDTDWYESTYHELHHLFPRLSPGGILIIDDYGHYKGAREAVDRYILESGTKILLNRIDYTGRIGIKAGDET